MSPVSLPNYTSILPLAAAKAKKAHALLGMIRADAKRFDDAFPSQARTALASLLDEFKVPPNGGEHSSRAHPRIIAECFHAKYVASSPFRLEIVGRGGHTRCLCV